MRLWRERGRDVLLSNPAVNGYTTDDLIAEELPLVSSFRPTLVTILIGANDIVRGTDAESYRAQLARIFAALGGIDVVGLPQPDWSLAPMGGAFGDRAGVARRIERFNALMAEAAERAGARYVDLFPLMREQGRKHLLAADGLHPSAEAYAEWARALATSASASSP